MRYCLITDNIPGSPQDLPQTWENISNFYALPHAELATYSWYPCVEIDPPAYDLSTQKLIVSRTFDGTQVVQSWNIVTMSAGERLIFLRSIRPMFAQYLEEHMTQQVSYRDYDNIDSAISRYQGCKIPDWSAESKEAQDFLCDCYAIAYQLENDVLAGIKPIPTREEFIAALPLLGWGPPA